MHRRFTFPTVLRFKNLMLFHARSTHYHALTHHRHPLHEYLINTMRTGSLSPPFPYDKETMIFYNYKRLSNGLCFVAKRKDRCRPFFLFYLDPSQQYSTLRWVYISCPRPSATPFFISSVPSSAPSLFHHNPQHPIIGPLLSTQNPTWVTV